ncbi:DUF2177 family protein [bacterium]|nr:DUF2177 family protein [bacterium]
MNTLAVAPVAALITTLLVLDGIYLTATAPTSRAVIAAVQGSPLQIRWPAAAAVYALIAAAVWFFAVAPAAGSPAVAAGRGAAIGAAMYGLYDLTNYATLSRYPLAFALQDIVWGTVLCATVAAATVAIAKVTAI